MEYETLKLRRRLSALPVGNGRRYATKLRTEIAQIARGLRAAKVSWHGIAEAIGIPTETIRGFCGLGSKVKHAFVAVEVAEPTRGAGVVLLCPGGYRVEGLRIEDAADLLRRLR